MHRLQQYFPFAFAKLLQSSQISQHDVNEHDESMNLFLLEPEAETRKLGLLKFVKQTIVAGDPRAFDRFSQFCKTDVLKLMSRCATCSGNWALLNIARHNIRPDWTPSNSQLFVSTRTYRRSAKSNHECQWSSSLACYVSHCLYMLARTRKGY